MVAKPRGGVMGNVLFKEGMRVFRFSLVGAFSVFTYYALLYGLTEYFNVWYIGSAFAAFVGYFITNFWLQKHWVFENRDKMYVKRQIKQFSIMAVCNWVVNTSLLYLIVEYFGFWYLHVQAVLTVVVSIIAYYAMRYIFRIK